jgi:hypothetical protein
VGTRKLLERRATKLGVRLKPVIGDSLENIEIGESEAGILWDHALLLD